MIMSKGIFSFLISVGAVIWLIWMMAATSLIEEDGRLDRACLPVDWSGSLIRSVVQAVYPPWVINVQEGTVSTSRWCELTIYRFIDEQKVVQCEADVAAFKIYLQDLSTQPDKVPYVNAWVKYFHGKRFWVVCDKYADQWKDVLQRGNYYNRIAIEQPNWEIAL